MPTAADHLRAPAPGPAREAGHSRSLGTVGCAALVAVLLTSAGLGTPPGGCDHFRRAQCRRPGRRDDLRR
jgi:hypothetical protein